MAKTASKRRASEDSMPSGDKESTHVPPVVPSVTASSRVHVGIKKMKSSDHIQPASTTSTPSPTMHMMRSNNQHDHDTYCAPTPYGPSAYMAPTPLSPDMHHPPLQRRKTSMDHHPMPPPRSSHPYPTTSSYQTNGGPPPPSRAPPPSTNDVAMLEQQTARLWNFDTWECGDQYKFVRPMGQGSYGQVAEAYDTVRNTRVAIKRVINVFDRAQDCIRLFREIYILRHVRHSNLVTMIDVIPPKDYDSFRDLYLVFEYADTDLQKLFCLPQYLNIRHVQVFLHQLLQGVKHMHECAIVHRDLKPANILLNETLSLKICDFGLARVCLPDQTTATNPATDKDMNGDLTAEHAAAQHASDSPVTAGNHGASGITRKYNRQMTKHVVSRYYRAPELILLQDYGRAVDMWSIGCIFGELLNMQAENCQHYLNRKPLFPGRSCTTLSPTDTQTYKKEMDQLFVIFNVIGTPDEDDIAHITTFAPLLRQIPKKVAVNLQDKYPGAPPEALDLLGQLLQFNPAKRLTVRASDRVAMVTMGSGGRSPRASVLGASPQLALA
ncbi:CMGC/MAPK protein kinase, variant [Aphanomyces invadans]|uniref:CMGC/MAPK protein kinase, variant n=1 Tax=Aphanomyces invadans TaxID=157072 RepID=A0A024ULE2_9STRA|nr:CMGC/MAPK protein kinase, variant [Aphanomyces invadans]ETW06990.1 CMGC/MAPK protein kinase, variant [Aphanomyces invadans]|eukprot:XP_008865065.1 CMGC/MAPK protein kinase, variant [Aphanomyces invadans]